jgi:hypothetical protein
VGLHFGNYLKVRGIVEYETTNGTYNDFGSGSAIITCTHAKAATWNVGILNLNNIPADMKNLGTTDVPKANIRLKLVCEPNTNSVINYNSIPATFSFELEKDSGAGTSYVTDSLRCYFNGSNADTFVGDKWLSEVNLHNQ